MTMSGPPRDEKRKEPEIRPSMSGAAVESSDLYLDYATQGVVDEIEGEARVEDQVLKLAVLPEAKRRQVLGALSPGTQAKILAFMQSHAPSSQPKSTVPSRPAPAPTKSPSAAKSGCSALAAGLVVVSAISWLLYLLAHL